MVPLDLYSRSRVGDGMTNVEALMAVEAGEQPSECKIYYERDERKLWALWWSGVSAFLVVFAIMVAWQMPTSPYPVLIGLAAAIAAVIGIPVEEEEPDRLRILVITPRGAIVRGPGGLKNWHFDELTRVMPYSILGQAQLCLRDVHGRDHLLDYRSFEAPEEIYKQLRSRVGQP